MANLPKPLIGLLLGTVAFFAIWMVALKPSSSSSSNGGSPSGVGQYQSAINQAHQAVTTSNQANAKLGAPTATARAPKPATSAKTVAKPAAKATPVTKTAAKPATKTKTTAKPATKTKPHAAAVSQSGPASAAAAVKTVENAVREDKVIAVLFYNPAAPDDLAMKSELAAIPTAHGQLVKVAVPVSELTQFAMITTQVPVVTSPTLVIINREHRATTLTGWASVGEMAMRIVDAAISK